MPRTANSLEGWHQAFNKRVAITHPSLSKPVKKIKDEQASTEFILEQSALGANIEKINKKYIRINERIRKIHATYNKDEGLSYLRAIAFLTIFLSLVYMHDLNKLTLIVFYIFKDSVK